MTSNSDYELQKERLSALQSQSAGLESIVGWLQAGMLPKHFSMLGPICPHPAPSFPETVLEEEEGSSRGQTRKPSKALSR